MKPYWLAASLCALGTLFIAPVAGCKDRAPQITLAPGYKGPVFIDCGSVADSAQDVQVDQIGHGETSCPKEPEKFVVMRDGKPIEPDAPISWLKTGDGITVGLKFKVR